MPRRCRHYRAALDGLEHEGLDGLMLRSALPDERPHPTVWRVELEELAVEDELRPVRSPVHNPPGATDTEIDSALGHLEAPGAEPASEVLTLRADLPDELRRCVQEAPYLDDRLVGRQGDLGFGVGRGHVPSPSPVLPG